MSPAANGDAAVVRDLAKHYADSCAEAIHDERRDLWRRHNSLQHTLPLIIVRGGRAWGEVPEITFLQCTDPLLRGYERSLRLALFRRQIDDDFIPEPWLTVRASFACTGWGLSASRTHPDDPKGSWKADYPIRALADIDRLHAPEHAIDEEATARNAAKLRDAVGDIIDVNVDRSPAYRVWSGDLSTDMGRLRGIENFMLDMMDSPEWMHRLAGFLRDGVLRTHEQAEAAGDWGRSASENQAMPYAVEVNDPAANVNGAIRKQLWGYMAAQEFTLVSPQMHDEFLLQYQLPILSQFGLTAYGCCEDLTRKIDILRQIPNLRRIAVAPVADLASCAEQIGGDYVISWRPNPAEAVCCGFDPDRIRRTTREGLAICRGQQVDITLKDIDTVQNDPRRLVEWAKIVREVVEEAA